MTPIEPVEILLDKPRKILINHRALYKTEQEVNRQRFAKPDDYVQIHKLMVDSFNNMFRASGLLPMDLLLSLISNSLIAERGEKKLTMDEVADLLDKAETGMAEISAAVWTAYFSVAGRNLKTIEPGDEKKTDPATTNPSGSINGASGESS